MSLSFKSLYLVCALLFCGLIALAQDAKTTQQLYDLKKHNNLTEWLYVRIDYANAHPQQNLFLGNTQKETWRQPVSAAEQVAWLTLLSSEGYNQLQAGDILSSINYYEDAYTYFRKYKVVQFDVVEYVLKPLSNNYTRLGDYERALYIQLKSVERLDTFDNSDDVASIYSNIVITYYNMGNYTEALRYIDKGLKLAKAPDVYFRLRNTLANVLYEKGDLLKSSAILKQIIASQKEDDKTYFSLYNAYHTLGVIDIKHNALNEAERSFVKALQMIDTKWLNGDLVRERATTMAQLGKIQRLKKQPQRALILFNRALQMFRVNSAANKTELQNIYGENKLVEIFHEKALTYLQLNQADAALENMRYALLATDKMRKEFADNKTKERLQQEGKDLAEEAIEIAYHLYQKNKDKPSANLILSIAEQTKARTLADQIQKNNQQLAINGNDTTMRQRLNTERAIAYNERLLMTEKDGTRYQKKIAALKFDLALLNKKYREQIDVGVLSSNDILKKLPGNLHVVEFFFGLRSVFKIEVNNRTVTNVSRIDSAEQFRQRLSGFIDTYYHNGPDAMVNDPQSFKQTSHQIYNALFNNIDLQNDERLCIVPDDVLGYLSFDGLVTDLKRDLPPSQWPYLIKKVSVTYAFSLNTLVTNNGGNNAGNGFSGLFITHDKAKDKPIIAVKQESAAIEKLVGGNYFYDDKVNTASFFNAFENSSVMHISTHAYLSGANKEPTLDLGNQKLFLFELLSRQNNPKLIVLSACRTGDGLLAKGEGIISLSRGFSAIGTPATIAGLWNVNDQAAAAITAQMYAGLVKGQSSGTALHNAKLGWLNKQQVSDALYLPYYWDSLILMGTDEPLHLKPVDDFLLYYYSLAGLGLSIILLLVWRKMAKNGTSSSMFKADRV